MRAPGRGAGADESVLKAYASGGCQLRDQAREVVARGETVANEEDFLRRAASRTLYHAFLEFGAEGMPSPTLPKHLQGNIVVAQVDAAHDAAVTIALFPVHADRLAENLVPQRLPRLPLHPILLPL